MATGIGQYVHVFADENPNCQCSHKCCTFDGCCSRRPHRNVDTLPYVERYTPTKIEDAVAQKQHAGRRGFFDLPGEIRNKIYAYTVLTVTVVRMKLNPTIMDHGEEKTWGVNNKFAMLGVCRRIYHEASPLAYQENYFEVVRSKHRDFSIRKHLGMPYKHIRLIMLLYPMEANPCTWNMTHMWSHWLEDAYTMLKHFPNLHRLFLKLAYNAWDPRTLYHYYSWAPLFFKRPKETDEEMSSRIVQVLRSMTHLHGRKMPKCVQFRFWAFFSDASTEDNYPPYHNPDLLNDAILKVADAKINLNEYATQSRPLYWPESTNAEDEGNPMELDGEVSSDSDDN